MLLAVSGIVHATPRRRTFADEISEPVATRWFSRSPLAESHGGAGTVPDVAAASAIVVRTRTPVAARYAVRPTRLAGKLERRRPNAALASTHTTSTPPATKNGALERSTAAISSVLVPDMRAAWAPPRDAPDACALRAIRRRDGRCPRARTAAAVRTRAIGRTMTTPSARFTLSPRRQMWKVGARTTLTKRSIRWARPSPPRFSRAHGPSTPRTRRSP